MRTPNRAMERKAIRARPAGDLVRLLLLILVWPACVLAQGQEVPSPPAAAAPTTAARTFSEQELDQLIAPIALYPDALLAQVLMASTYPLEVVEAHRWAQGHSYLAGDQLQAALQEQTWDPSVKGLVTVPQVLAMMDEKLDWTEKLGDAFLAQRQDVMETVQRLRAKAQAAGNLSSTPQQTVVTEGEAIAIEPVNPQVIYVPVYNPAVIYGPWWWPAPPYYWYPPGYYAGPGPFIYFGFGVVVGAAIWGTCDWGHRTVIVNVHNYNTFNRTSITNPHWAHDVYHRRGVPYKDDAIRREYRRELPGADGRRDFRGYEAPSRIRELPRPSGQQIRQEPAQPGARPVPGAGDRVPRASPAPGQQPPSVGQRFPVAPPVARQPPAVEQRLPPAPTAPRQPPDVGQRLPPPAPPISRQPPSVGQRFPVAPPVGRQPPGVSPRVPPAFETFGRGDAARTYSDRGAASRGAVPYAPPAGAQGARPPGGGAQSIRPQGAPGGGAQSSRPQSARPPQR